MHRAGATKGIHRHSARIFAPLVQVSACRIGHIFVDDLMHAPGGLFDCHSKRLG
jgi:hypothetical protein